MANHSKHARSSTFAMPSKSSLVKIAATVAAVGLLATGGIVSRNLYTSAEQNTANQVTAFSVTDSAEASRGNARELLNGDTSYVTVKINGKSRVVPGTNFTDVKSVLDAGDITLEPEDTVSPSLTTKVDEKTVITIQRAGASVEVSDTAIGFNVVKKETSSLPEGQEKVETEGEEGVMETTNLVTKSGDTVVSSNMISSYVKKAPVDKVILVGTGSTSSSSSSASASIGTTVRRAKCSSGLTIICCRTATPKPISPPPYTSSPTSPAGASPQRIRVRALWSAPGVAWQQDGERGRRLGHQLSDSAQVVLGLLRAALWFHSGSLHVLAGQSLLLNRD